MRVLIHFLFVNMAFANAPTHLQPKALACTSFPNKRAECHIADDFKPLTALHPDIHYLTIIGGNFALLQDKPFSSLKFLEQLSMIENKLENITSSAFEGSTNLTKLLLHGHISHIDENAFNPCPLLNELNLCGNKISQLQPLANAVSHLKHLETLILSRNPIETIKNEDFDGLSNSPLTSLDLTNSNISTIHKKAFSCFQHLTIFCLPLNTLDEENLSNALENITIKLRYLTLTNSTLKEVPTKALRHISSFEIQKLNFAGHQFKTIKKDDFPSMPYLLRLVVSYGVLEYIDGEVFDNLPALKELDLNNNHLSDLPLNMPVLNHLTRLELQHNHITLNQSFLYFSSMPNLIDLNLSFNNISYIILEHEKNLNRLDKLYLEHNNIIPWHKSVIQGELKEFDIANNKLDIVTSAMLDDFDKVHILELHNNPFNCSVCQMIDFAKWLSDPEHLEMSLGITCVVPDNTKVVKIIKPEHCKT